MTDRRYVAFTDNAYAFTDDERVYQDGDLPAFLLQVAPTEAQIRDLSWFSLAVPKSGYWPIEYDEAPSFDAATHTLDGFTFLLEVDAKEVVATPFVRSMTPDELAAIEAAKPQPIVLGKGELLDLVLSTNVTIDEVKAATDDPNMASFWFVLNNFYTQIRRDHPFTRQGINGMAALGHISQAQADQVFVKWPLQ